MNPKKSSPKKPGGGKAVPKGKPAPAKQAPKKAAPVAKAPAKKAAAKKVAAKKAPPTKVAAAKKPPAVKAPATKAPAKKAASAAKPAPPKKLAPSKTPPPAKKTVATKAAASPSPAPKKAPSAKAPAKAPVKAPVKAPPAPKPAAKPVEARKDKVAAKKAPPAPAKSKPAASAAPRFDPAMDAKSRVAIPEKFARKLKEIAPPAPAEAKRAPAAPALALSKGVFRDAAMERSLVEAARVGVAILRKYHRNLVGGIDKKGAVDLVTRADREAEERVMDYLRKRHPDHTLIGEESWNGKRDVPAGFAWILDPVDGTTNYAHGMDHYALSLGLVHDGRPVAGLVVDVGRDHWYRATLGGGAFRDRDRLAVSKYADLSDCVLATGFPYDRRARLPELMATYGVFLSKVQAIRRMGVASLDLALTAAGQFDGYYESPLQAWDVAAGVLLVTEAGGKITDYDEKPIDLFRPSVLASNGLIHSAMAETIREVRKELEEEGI